MFFEYRKDSFLIHQMVKSPLSPPLHLQSVAYVWRTIVQILSKFYYTEGPESEGFYLVLGRTGKFRTLNLRTSRKSNLEPTEPGFGFFAIEPNLPRPNLEPLICFEKLLLRAKFLANLLKNIERSNFKVISLKNVLFSDI